MRTIVLLVLSNVFMTFAWYAHLKDLRSSPLYVAILASWGIALFEYMLQVPANRAGYGTFSLGQLKIMQEVITLSVFIPFAVLSTWGSRSSSTTSGRDAAWPARSSSYFAVSAARPRLASSKKRE